MRTIPLRSLAACLFLAAATSLSAQTLPSPADTGPDSLSLPALPPHAPTPLDAAAAATPHDAAALGGYNVLIADRGNRRLLIVTPQKQTIWEYHFKAAPPGNGADDSFFADGGKSVLTNLEHSHVIRKIDIATGKLVWDYGKMNVQGSGPNRLYYPDDAYQLPGGNIVVADIRNCRILEIAPDKHIVRQAGRTGDCSGRPGTLRSPNGDRPLANGHLLVSEIQGHWLTELDEHWKQVLRFQLPILYPSDPQPTRDGNIVVAGYTNPGNIIIVNRQQKVLWRYTPLKDGGLNRPSLAEELPNGNILATDDLNHRIVVIDPKTNRILWQYGVKGHPGEAPGYLRIPDGLDIIPEVKAPQGQVPQAQVVEVKS
ncbi:MAG: PQQ-binding-like beta-propeller repeat protein [Paracoccaceae bacterium]|nr:PQQ-binding-like beta-propeller repeat protein [Paracoccaceae bacterium]